MLIKLDFYIVHSRYFNSDYYVRYFLKYSSLRHLEGHVSLDFSKHSASECFNNISKSFNEIIFKSSYYKNIYFIPFIKPKFNMFYVFLWKFLGP